MNVKSKFKGAVLATALSAALLTTSGPAAAYVYGDAGLSIDGLTIVIGGSAVTIDRFDFSLQSTATLNGVSAPTSTATCGGTPGPGNNNCGTSPVLDAPPANAPGSTTLRTNNASTGGEFTSYGPLVGGNYSNSDTVITTAELVNLQSPTSTREIAESLLTSGATAQASAQIQSTTGFILTFTVGTGPGPGTLTLNFNADPDLEAAIFGEPSGSYSAQANVNVSFTLTRKDPSGVTVSLVQWSPTGTAANDCIAFGGPSCTETNDSQSLNRNVSTTTNNTKDDFSFDPNALTLTPFGISVTGLAAGTYSLALNEQVSTRLARTPRAVPEPGSLALLGVGILGFLASRRKKLG